MEYQRIEHGEEIVLTYCPARQVEEVELRYERELPQRLRTEPEFVREDAALPTGAKKRRKKSWIAVTAVVLCLVLAVGCLGVGIWGIVDSFANIFPGVSDSADSDDGSEEAEDKNDNGNDDSTPDRQPNRGEQDETDDSDRSGDPKIEVFRPGDDAPNFRLTAVGAGRRVLTATEIYAKVAPSTVTILGIHGETYSVGTGIIFTSDGYIMTNHHVIAACLECEVWVTDQYGVDTVYKARYVGGDEEKDLAVLKIEAEGLPVAEFGVSSALSVGDKVYAIGNPLGTELRSTLTDGIVSAVDRNVDVDGVTMTLIQTNAALNSGNSGGPLINEYGQVVGINTIKMMSGYDTIEGLGFAIPTSLAERWINDILALGKVRPTPILGVSVNRIPVKLPDGTVGLEVLDVTKGLGAFLAGVKVGDVVVEFNGAKVNRVEDIYAQRVKLSVGDKVSIRVYRNGEYLDLTMMLLAEVK